MWRSAVQLCLGLHRRKAMYQAVSAMVFKLRGISSVGLEHLPCTQGVKGSSPLFSTVDDASCKIVLVVYLITFFKIDIYIYTIYKKSSLTYWNVSEYDSQQLKIKEVFSLEIN